MKASFIDCCLYVFLMYIAAVAAYKCDFRGNANNTKLIRFERDPYDCRVYHICGLNRTYTFTCVEGFYFDSKNNICNYANLVECETLEAKAHVEVNETKISENTAEEIDTKNYIFGGSSENVDETETESDGGEDEYYNENEDEFEVEIEVDDDEEEDNLEIFTTAQQFDDIEKFVEKNAETTTVVTNAAIDNTTSIPSSTTLKNTNSSTRPWWLGPTECIVGFSHRIPHETNCGKYYECQINGEKVEYACIYPMLFDEFYYECKPYETVDCGTRKEAKDLCDYRLSKSSLHSIPCYMYPSCKNLSDGLYPDIMRDCRHYFQCKDERTINTNYCPQNSTYGGLKFNYYTKRCDSPMRVSYTCGGFSIPIDIYTNKMVCPMGSIITYFAHPSECNIYLACINGRVSSMVCPEGTHFSGKHQKCMEPSLAKCQNAPLTDEALEVESDETVEIDTNVDGPYLFEQNIK